MMIYDVRSLSRNTCHLPVVDSSSLAAQIPRSSSTTETPKSGKPKTPKKQRFKRWTKKLPKKQKMFGIWSKKSVIVNAKSFPDVQSEHSQTLAITAASVEDRQVCAKCQCALYRRAVQKSSPNLPGQVSSECQVVSFSPVPQCLGGLVTPFWLSQWHLWSKQHRCNWCTMQKQICPRFWAEKNLSTS